MTNPKKSTTPPGSTKENVQAPQSSDCHPPGPAMLPKASQELLRAQAPPDSTDMASEVSEPVGIDEADQADDEEANEWGNEDSDEGSDEDPDGSIEWDIVHRIVEDAVDLGYGVSVFGENGWPLPPCQQQ